MRSNSGKDEGRNNLRDPTIRDHNEQRTKLSRRSRTSHAKAPADHRGGRLRLAYAIVIGDPVERECEHQLAARAGQPSALSASRIPSPAQTTRHRISARPGPALATASLKRRRASICAP